MSVNVTQLLDRPRPDRPRPDQPRRVAHSVPAAHPSLSEAPHGPVEGRGDGDAGPGAPVRPRTAWRTPQTAGQTPWQDAWLAC